VNVVFGNLWDFPADAHCITTNCEIKKNNAAVMGRGVAKQAMDRFPGIEFRLAQLISDYDSEVGIVWDRPVVIAFPTKYQWRNPADLDLIKRSAHQLVTLTFEHEFKSVVLPRPGVGLGNLDWADVEPVLAHILDDRFSVICPKIGRPFT
jgi:hypothetical protein